MSDDLLNSPRGPSVLGILLGMVVLVGFGFLTFIVFGEVDKTGQERQLVGQAETIERLKLEKQRIELRIEEMQEQAARRSEVEEVEAAKKGLEKSVGLLSGKVADLEEELTELKSAMRERVLAERTRAIGLELNEDLRTKDGEVFKNPKITGLDPRGIEIVERSTEGRRTRWIDFERLPDDLRTRFGFSEAEKEIYVAKLEARKKKMAEERRKKDQKDRDGLAERKRQEEIDKLTKELERVRSRIDVARLEIGAALRTADENRELLQEAQRKNRRGPLYETRIKKAEEEAKNLEEAIGVAELKLRVLEGKLQALGVEVEPR